MAHPSFQQVMIRVKERDSAVAFFEKNFGMTVIDRKDAPAHGFDLTFMASLSEAEIASLPEPGTPEANKYLWTFPRTVLELTHNYGTESDPEQKYENGNSDPHRGFGHVGFLVDDLPAFCDKLEANGVKFHKRLSEGKVNTVAFVLEPSTGYWIALLERSKTAPPTEVTGKPTLQQAMVRVKDAKASIKFYQDHFGMSVVWVKHQPAMGFSIYNMGVFPEGTVLPADPESEEAQAFVTSTSHTLLNLCHNHGTEDKPAGEKVYCPGNCGKCGYGHIGFLVNGLEATCEALEAKGVAFRKRPHEGFMRGIAFALDPDGYSIELIERGHGASKV